MYGVAGFHSLREEGCSAEARSGLGIMEPQKLGVMMRGMERKRACGARAAKDRACGRIGGRSVARRAAGVRRRPRRRVVGSMGVNCVVEGRGYLFVVWWTLEIGRAEIVFQALSVRIG